MFLRSLNSSQPHYLGQTGLGTAEELGRLALEPGENFCMGGPGMIFSREVLRRMVPHISTCLREMYTTHEDVEVGRCVRRFGGTQCVWSYEVRLESGVCMCERLCFRSLACGRSRKLHMGRQRTGRGVGRVAHTSSVGYVKIPYMYMESRKYPQKHFKTICYIILLRKQRHFLSR